jgi:hypothetical protein
MNEKLTRITVQKRSICKLTCRLQLAIEQLAGFYWNFRRSENSWNWQSLLEPLQFFVLLSKS